MLQVDSFRCFGFSQSSFFAWFWDYCFVVVFFLADPNDVSCCCKSVMVDAHNLLEFLQEVPDLTSCLARPQSTTTMTLETWLITLPTRHPNTGGSPSTNAKTSFSILATTIPGRTCGLFATIFYFIIRRASTVHNLFLLERALFLYCYKGSWTALTAAFLFSVALSLILLIEILFSNKKYCFFLTALGPFMIQNMSRVLRQITQLPLTYLLELLALIHGLKELLPTRSPQCLEVLAEQVLIILVSATSS